MLIATLITLILIEAFVIYRQWRRIRIQRQVLIDMAALYRKRLAEVHKETPLNSAGVNAESGSRGKHPVSS